MNDLIIIIIIVMHCSVVSAGTGTETSHHSPKERVGLPVHVTPSCLRVFVCLAGWIEGQ